MQLFEDKHRIMKYFDFGVLGLFYDLMGTTVITFFVKITVPNKKQ